jgi:hypothetical protein
VTKKGGQIRTPKDEPWHVTPAPQLPLVETDLTAEAVEVEEVMDG